MRKRPSNALAEKLRSAADIARAVEKKGHNSNGDFDFARALDVGEEARRLLKEKGIVLIPSLEDYDLRIAKSGVLVFAHLSFEIIDAETGESKVKKWIGSGIDNPGDKALYTAITGGRKYFVANLLEIPIGTDPEEGATADSLADLDKARRLRQEQDIAATQPDVPGAAHA